MPTLNLKSVIILTTGLAVILNVGQFAHDALATKNTLMAKLPQAQTPSATDGITVRVVTADSTPETTPAPTPAVDPAAIAATTLAKAGLKADYASIYLAAQNATGTPWQVIAAVHVIETGQSGSTTVRSYAGAIGPMQFMPATFRAYAVDGDVNGVKDIGNINDAIFSAGRYLAASGAAKGQIRKALYNYNHSWSYVDKVQSVSHRLGL